jgi:rhodanese-related sulfurtransferase
MRIKAIQLKQLPSLFIRMIVLVFLFSLVGVVVNILRPQPLAWVATVPYEVFVPCPEILGDSIAVEPSLPLLTDAGILWIDARSKDEYDIWHIKNAVNIPFDYLEPVDDKHVSFILNSGAKRIIIYGDGGKPDSGNELGAELSGKGIRNIHHIEGGSVALQKMTGQKNSPPSTIHGDSQ